MSEHTRGMRYEKIYDLCNHLDAVYVERQYTVRGLCSAVEPHTGSKRSSDTCSNPFLGTNSCPNTCTHCNSGRGARAFSDDCGNSHPRTNCHSLNCPNPGSNDRSAYHPRADRNTDSDHNTGTADTYARSGGHSRRGKHQCPGKGLP